MEKGPHVVEVQPGQNYDWCRCGRSPQAPFCTATCQQGLRFHATARRLLWFCACGHSSTPPFCDGRSHQQHQRPADHENSPHPP